MLHTNVLDNIKKDGDQLREKLKKQGIILINVMASPGGGKTTTLVSLIHRMKEEHRIGVLEADLDSDVDADKVHQLSGVEAVQIHTDTLCHIDSDMTSEGIERFQNKDLDLIFLENIGNMVCPADFDTGSHINICILSVPEGTAKVYNYARMFQHSDFVLINKMDAIDFFDFNLKEATEFIQRQNPSVQVLPYSAKTKEGLEEIISRLEEKIDYWRR
ncbi:MAG: hydrogenase nickel incorporation protein HypB [Bacilli bacterium]|nr:hydrogenase nickel incorporation protein HypB [Bacilli bacterium]